MQFATLCIVTANSSHSTRLSSFGVIYDDNVGKQHLRSGCLWFRERQRLDCRNLVIRSVVIDCV